MMRRAPLALLLIAMIAACDDGRVVPPPTMTLTPRDAAAPDAISDLDAGVDDAGGGADANETIDSGESDAGAFEDASAAPDATTAPDATAAPDAAAPDAAPRDAGMMMGSGCGRPQMSGMFNGQITVRGVRRTAIVSIPAGYDPNRPYAVVFAWHGQNWMSDSFRNAHTDLETANGGEAIVMWPQSQNINGAFSWDLNGNGADVEFYDLMLDYLMANFCVDTSRVFSFGRSFGAAFTNVLGCMRRSELRGLSAWAGWGPNGSCNGRVAAWVGHSQDDTTVGYQTATRDHYVRANGCSTMTMPAMPSPCVVYLGCQGGTQVRWCSHVSGGHSPPGDYGAQAWRFFDGL